MYTVTCECGSVHDTEDVKFLNIEEDIQGRDVMTFECPTTKETVKSLVFQGYKSC